jgi:hypothetical protein
MSDGDSVLDILPPTMKIYGKLLKKNGMKLYTLWVEPNKKQKSVKIILVTFFFVK